MRFSGGGDIGTSWLSLRLDDFAGDAIAIRDLRKFPANNEARIVVDVRKICKWLVLRTREVHFELAIETREVTSSHDSTRFVHRKLLPEVCSLLTSNANLRSKTSRIRNLKN